MSLLSEMKQDKMCGSSYFIMEIHFDTVETYCNFIDDLVMLACV